MRKTHRKPIASAPLNVRRLEAGVVARPHPSPLPQGEGEDPAGRAPVAPLIRLSLDGRGKSSAEQLAANVLALSERFLAPLRERFNALVSTVAREFGFTPEDLKRSNQAVLPARRAAVVLVVELLNPPLNREVLADWFGISDATLYRFQTQVRAAERNDEVFAARLQSIRAVLQTAVLRTAGLRAANVKGTNPNG